MKAGTYYSRNKEKCLLDQKLYRESHRASIKVRQARWYKKNKKRILAVQKKYKVGNEEYAEKARIRAKEYYWRVVKKNKKLLFDVIIWPESLVCENRKSHTSFYTLGE